MDVADIQEVELPSGDDSERREADQITPADGREGVPVNKQGNEFDLKAAYRALILAFFNLPDDAFDK